MAFAMMVRNMTFIGEQLQAINFHQLFDIHVYNLHSLFVI